MTTTDTGFVVSVENAGSIVVNSGGGNDSIELVDSDGDDVLMVSPTEMTLSGTPIGGSAYSVTANGFAVAHGYARRGGRDVAQFIGSNGSDRVKTYDNLVKMMGSDYYTRAKFFELVQMDLRGGTDWTGVAASDGADAVWAMKNKVRLAYGVELADGERPAFETMAYDVTIAGSERVVARAKGNDDWVELHDTALNDVLIARPHKVEMMNGPRAAEGIVRGDEYKITARGYGHISAVADRGGAGDVAKLYDSGEDGVDIWAAGYVDGETWSTMTSPSRLLYEVLAFERVGGYGFNSGRGKDHGTNRKDHGADVDFVFQHGYWEGDPDPTSTTPSRPRSRGEHAGR